MGHWELIIHLFTMTHSSTHGFHINLNDMLGSLSIQWLYLHDTNPASSMHCPLRPRAFIHPLHVPHSAQSNTQTPEEKGKIWVSGPLSYNKTRCVNLSWHSDPASLLQWPSSGVLVSLLNNTNYPTLCYLVPLALSFLATLLLCNQRYLRKMPICLCHTPASNLRSSLPTSPDTRCPLSPRRLLTILQTKHTLSKTCHLSVYDVLFLLLYLLNLIILWL